MKMGAGEGKKARHFGRAGGGEGSSGGEGVRSGERGVLWWGVWRMGGPVEEMKKKSKNQSI